MLPQVHVGCEWVLAGEGTATRKLDGTCCMIRGGKLYKRQEFKKGQPTPADFEEVNFDDETGKRIGWRPVGDAPEDEWHREGFANLEDKSDGTYELVGPKMQGNPENYTVHSLVPHTVERLRIADQVPRDFEGLSAYLVGQDIEGIVFHHPDGRMAKIKKRDFGLKR
ncbi:MAG TPA: DUF5565 family protein [Planctomycetaceae bacterium]|nr:DUF5565 family protein [Planctomycetaceae bacterium]